MQNIVAIHTGHDASVTYWKDYCQVYISKEERLNRIKNWGKSFPILSFQKLKQHIKIYEIDVLLLSRGFYDSKYFKEKSARNLKKFIKSIVGRSEEVISINMAMRLNGASSENNIFDVSQFLSDYGFRSDTIVRFCDHHIAHALPTLFFMPAWNNALLYTSDGGGDGLNYSFTYFDGNTIDVLYGGNDKLMKSWLPDSLGQMYGMVTQICGFKKNRHEGKITGLAAFAEPLAADEIIRQYYIDTNGRILPHFSDYEQLDELLKNIFSTHGRETLASSAQYALEQLTLESIEKLKSQYSFDNIGLSGGVCSNVRLNQLISEVEDINDLFVFPSMTDEGLVVGYVLDYLLKRDGLKDWLSHRRDLDDVYWGEDLQLKMSDLPSEFKIICTDDIAQKTAELLERNHVCALYTARMEYGPRALGARSILINPSDSSINDTVNARLDRTEFMPFAPVVLDDLAEDVFEITSSNREAMRFMTITTNVKEQWKDKIQATVHVDSTSRPQIIQRKDNPLYYDILQSFYELTGIPCLVNTSFNAHEEPIINTPSEALTALKDDRVDYLVFSNMIVSNQD